MNICKQCTFSNHEALLTCEMCYTPLEGSSPRPQFKDAGGAKGEAVSVGGAVQVDVDGVNCPQCTMLNKRTALQCSVCHSILPQWESKENRDNNNVVDFDGGFARSSSSSSNSSSSSSSVGNGGRGSGDRAIVENSSAFYGNQATDGLVPLLENNLRLTTSTWSLCSPCTHFTQLNAVGAEWACGFRNIQMMCMSLIQVPRYRSLLFNGDGDIPDVNGIQSWIEKAWADGFDVAGAADFPNGLLGTSSWVGPSECVSMLRYFGIRAHVVDFLDEDYVRQIMNGQIAASVGNNARGVMTIANYECDICSMRIEGHRYRCTVRDNYDLCEACEMRNEQPFPMTKIKVESKYGKPQSRQGEGVDPHTVPSSSYQDGGAAQAYTGGGQLNFIPLANHVSSTSSSGRRTSAPKSYSDFGGYNQGDDHEDGGGAGNKRKRGSEEAWNDNAAGAWPIQWTENAASDQGPKKKNKTSKNSQSLVNWIERYFEAFQAASFDPQSENDKLVHPLYLQHDGHSRTVVGFQNEEKKTNLLIFDPAVRGGALKQCLEGGQGWQKHIKRQVSTFDVHRHLQVVYVSGVMSKREREVSKMVVPKDPEESLMTTIKGLEEQQL